MSQYALKHSFIQVYYPCTQKRSYLWTEFNYTPHQKKNQKNNLNLMWLITADWLICSGRSLSISQPQSLKAHNILQQVIPH